MTATAWDEGKAVACVDWLRVLTAGPRYTLHTCLMGGALLLASAMPVALMIWVARRAFADLAESGVEGLSIFEAHEAEGGVRMHFIVLFFLFMYGLMSFSHLWSRWAIMGLAWYGWDAARGWPLGITLINMVYYVGSLTCFAALRTTGSLTANSMLLAVLIATTAPSVLMVFGVVKLSSRMMTWRQVAKLVAVSTCLEWVAAVALHQSLIAFYSTEDGGTRFAIRLLPVVVRRIWLHGNCLISLKYNINYEEHRFLFLVLPIGSTAITGTAMQLMSSTAQVMAMSIVLLFFEVVDGLFLLSGSTQLHSCVAFGLFTCTTSRRQLNAVFPTSAEADAEAEAPSAETVRKLQEEEARLKRMPLLVDSATQVCVAETASAVLVTVMLLFFPIAPVTGGSLNRSIVIQHLGISLTFELLGDYIIASISEAVSQLRPERMCSAVKARAARLEGHFSTAAAFGIILITIVSVLSVFLSSHCVYPDASSEDGYFLRNCPAAT